MRFTAREERGVVVFVAPAELDAAVAPDLDQALSKAMADGKNHIVIDLKATSLIDSSGLAVLVRALKRARAASGNVILSGLQPPVQKVFELTRLDKAFDIYGDGDEAVRRSAK